MLKENKMNNFDRAEKACYERLKNQNKKTNREIELEKKLEIAVKALEEIVADESCVSCMDCLGSAYAEKALEKIKEVK